MPLTAPVAAVVDEATGRRHRDDPVVGHTGGPAGNARLTAWTGILLLALVLAELITLLDVNGLISWHVVIGTLFVGTALLKTTSTTWRMGRYYTGHHPYRVAGPPPMLLRLLGPLVVATTLGLLGTGLALLALGPNAGRRPVITVAGFGLDPVTLHQALFFAFAGAAGLHLIARLVPAVRLITGRVRHSESVPGGVWRLSALILALAAAAMAAALVLSSATPWRHEDRGPRDRYSTVQHSTSR